jgi:hypothetical protein
MAAKKQTSTYKPMTLESFTAKLHGGKYGSAHAASVAVARSALNEQEKESASNLLKQHYAVTKHGVGPSKAAAISERAEGIFFRALALVGLVRAKQLIAQLEEGQGW